MRGRINRKEQKSPLKQGHPEGGLQNSNEPPSQPKSSEEYSETGFGETNEESSNSGWGLQDEKPNWGCEATEPEDFFDSTRQGNCNDEQRNECIHCKGSHSSSDCPTAFRNERSRDCFKCGEAGHFANSCPSTRGGGSRYGEQAGNRSYDGYGRNRDTAGQSGFQNFRERDDQGSRGSYMERCSNCDGKGHSASVCPSVLNRRGGDTFGSENSNFSAFTKQRPSETIGQFSQQSGHNRSEFGRRDGTDATGESGAPYRTTVKITEEEAVNRNNTGINFDRYDDIQIKICHSNGQHAKEFENQKLETFQESRLCRELTDMLAKMNFQRPTPVQRYAIPILRAGKDLMACAQTGSGKTAAFVLPIVDSLIQLSAVVQPDVTPQKPYALILTPTRELTVQITKDAQSYCLRTEIYIKECYGGTDVGVQIRNIRRGCHLLVGTLGRVKDFLNRGIVSLEKVKYLVLDEADRMLDMGFSQDVDEVLSHATRAQAKKPQILMFSATFPKKVQVLATKYLNPDFIKLDVGVVGAVNADVEQIVERANGIFEKKKRLLAIIKRELEADSRAKILVFVEMRDAADKLAAFLCEMEIKATSMHGARFQQQREEALRDFQRHDCPVLVATSVAARGLDITGVSHVVNFDLPKEIEDYVHRVGRTGRVGNRGRATSFFDPNKDYELRDDLRQSLADGGVSPPDFLMS